VRLGTRDPDRSIEALASKRLSAPLPGKPAARDHDAVRAAPSECGGGRHGASLAAAGKEIAGCA
jgi:hypothetical protein